MADENSAVENPLRLNIDVTSPFNEGLLVKRGVQEEVQTTSEDCWRARRSLCRGAAQLCDRRRPMSQGSGMSEVYVFPVTSGGLRRTRVVERETVGDPGGGWIPAT